MHHVGCMALYRMVQGMACPKPDMV
jgi:hypothetical protein